MHQNNDAGVGAHCLTDYNDTMLKMDSSYNYFAYNFVKRGILLFCLDMIHTTMENITPT